MIRYEQFTKLIAKISFSVKFEGVGRACSVKPGDVFVVTNPQHMQDVGIKVDRSRKAYVNSGYLLSHDQFDALFSVETLK